MSGNHLILKPSPVWLISGCTAGLGQTLMHGGIHVTCVAPGRFHTDWAGRSLHRTASTLPDYAEAAARMAQTSQRNGHQAGDPEKAVEVIVTALQNPKLPHHLLLGFVA